MRSGVVRVRSGQNGSTLTTKPADIIYFSFGGQGGQGEIQHIRKHCQKRKSNARARAHVRMCDKLHFALTTLTTP
jgi:hypothetical protein